MFNVTNEHLELFYSKSIQLRYFLLFMLIFPFGVFAQDSFPRYDSIYYVNFPNSVELMCGQKIFQNEVLNGSLNDFDNYTIGEPLNYIGVGVTVIYWTNRKRYFPGTIGFNHFIPQEVSLSDTVSGRISGFNFRYAIFGYDFFERTRWLDLIVFPGFKTGRIRLFGDSRIEQVNAYFAPCVTLAPRFNIGKISLQFRVEYEFDITRSKWRKVWFSTSPKVDLGPMKSTGLSTSVSLGWVLD